MDSIDPQSALARLAVVAGLDLSSGCGDRGVVRMVLEDLLDTTLSSEGDIADALVHESHQPPIDPVVVAWDGHLSPIDVSAAATTHRVDGAVLVTEDGASVAASVNGSTVTFDDPLPHGLHTLSVGVDGREHLAMVIAAPRLVPALAERTWGVFASAFALRGADDRGVGNVSALRQLASTVHELGGGFIATLPLLPVFLDTPQEIVPFAPITRTAWNELNVDLALAPGAEAIGDVVTDPPEHTPRLVDYPDVARRHRASMSAYSKVVRDHPALRAQLDRFLVSNPRIANYARFRSLGETMSRDWRRWPAPWRAGDLSTAPVDPDIELLHQVGQWLAFTQVEQLIGEMRDRGQRLQLEITMGVHPLGFDIWSEQRVHMQRTRVLEPPDGTAMGSEWGHLAIRPERSRRRAHNAFHAAVRHHAQGGFLRLDQISALWRSWCVPDGCDRSQGVYLSHPAEEYLAIVCLEAHRAGAVVTGGNLSTAPAHIRERVRSCGLLDPLLDARRDNVHRHHNDDLGSSTGPAALIHLDELLADFGPSPLGEDDGNRWRVRHPRGFSADLDDERITQWFDEFTSVWGTRR